MKRIFLATLIAGVVVSSSGCAKMRCRDGCQGSGLFGRGGCHSCGLFGRGGRGSQQVADYGGPASAQVTYPYYTTRGPRDFLAPNPRGIGP